jgi:selenium-dependent xanthine dehydrogenase
MIEFILNDIRTTYEGPTERCLLSYLRQDAGIVSVKDGCSGQAACGACLLEIDGKPALACQIPMEKIGGTRVVTIEGFDENLRRILGRAFVAKGAVQCGFCTPGFLSRTKILLENNPDPSREEILQALRLHLCRCTGYIKIVEAIQLAARALREKRSIDITYSGSVGTRQPKYGAYERAMGRAPFVDDIKIDGLRFGALRFCDHPRARVIKIDVSKASGMEGVLGIYTAGDIPGKRTTGPIVADWPLMIKEGEITRYVGDVLAGVVAVSETIARRAADSIAVEYDIFEPLTDMELAETSSIKVHTGGNLLETCRIQRGGDVESALDASAHVASGTFHTQVIEHAYLETEAALAEPWQGNGIRLHVQSQGVYEDRRQVAAILGLPQEKVNVILVPCGGGFGGKEDLTVQGHAALFCYLSGKPVKVRLTRAESIRMHPKRHPMRMDYSLACDDGGRLTALKARILGDTGAYASVGAKVLERAAGHATGAYHLPIVDIVSKAVFTNNIPCGAMRGFGVNQTVFAVESLIDELCAKGGFDPWQFRFDNALTDGSLTATGQLLGPEAGVRETLLAVKKAYTKARYAGLACGIKNTGIGNGLVDECTAKIEIRSKDEVIVHYCWTEMGQGVHTVAVQTLCHETGIDPQIVKVMVETSYEAPAGMTTASRGTSLLANAIIDAAGKLKKALAGHSLGELQGKIFSGHWACDWTTKPGQPGEVVTHYSYGYATHLVVLDDDGQIREVHAAHDAGRVINPTLFEGQIQGAVHMGLGYALSEELVMQNGWPATTKLKALGILPAKKMPTVVIHPVEVADPLGPYGAKGVGEIGLVPTAGAVANALCQYDGLRRHRLPLLGNRRAKGEAT